MNENVVFFWGGECSQWYASQIVYRGINFNCAEQFMMYHKAILMGDDETAQKILDAPHPRQQKRLGREITNFDQKLWDTYKRHIVYTGNYLKFSQNPNLKEYLFDTGDNLIVEASPEDAIWGIGLSEYEASKIDPSEWPGQNLLGLAIMEVRSDLKKL